MHCSVHQGFSQFVTSNKDVLSTTARSLLTTRSPQRASHFSAWDQPGIFSTCFSAFLKLVGQLLECSQLLFFSSPVKQLYLHMRKTRSSKLWCLQVSVCLSAQGKAGSQLDVAFCSTLGCSGGLEVTGPTHAYFMASFWRKKRCSPESTGEQRWW